MGKRLIPPTEPAEIHEIMLRDALEERYLAYALSTIMHRALPDARDGLKPVHRRILYGMRLLRLDPTAIFKKSAKIVGDVMGSFHPHGDQSIYDALVRLAQDFSSRYPLVDGQGNFGNIDGDNAAAYRYTEARLTEVARLLLEGRQEDGWRGTWVVVVTEVPWRVQKSRLVEKVAELLNDKKRPLAGDGRDASAADARLVIEPRSRAVDSEFLMEWLFRLTELESRIP